MNQKCCFLKTFRNSFSLPLKINSFKTPVCTFSWNPSISLKFYANFTMICSWKNSYFFKPISQIINWPVNVKMHALRLSYLALYSFEYERKMQNLPSNGTFFSRCLPIAFTPHRQVCSRFCTWKLFWPNCSKFGVECVSNGKISSKNVFSTLFMRIFGKK